MRAAGIAILALLALAAALPAREPTKQELLVAIEKQLKAANETAGPCVACVVVSRSDRYPKPGGPDRPGKLGGYDPKEFLKANPGEDRLARNLDLSKQDNIPDHGYACGVVIDWTGLILTPYHVVEGATKIYVYLPGRAGSYADIHAADSRHDLAVLKLVTPPAEKLPTLTFANVRLEPRNQANVYPGKLVVLMANPYVAKFPVERPSAALGSVSVIVHPTSRPNQTPTSYYEYAPLIAHDAKPNAGLDGAALLNLDGELVGLTTSSALIPGGDRAPAAAFPADEYFRGVVDVLRRGEEVDYGYLGVLGPIGGPNGVTFNQVMAHGPAAQAGLTNQDVLTHINGAPTTSYEQLLHRIGSGLAGSKVRLTASRAGRTRDIEVTLGKFKHGQPYIASVRPDPVFGLRVDYGSLIGQGDPKADSLPDLPAGVCVRELEPNSPAAAAFKKLGGVEQRWLITRVNGAAVGKPTEFYRLAKDQKSVKLTVIDPTNPKNEREVTLP